MPGLNLAETGHSKLSKIGKNLTLMAAAWKDVCMLIKQHVDYYAWLRNEDSNLGHGPNQQEAYKCYKATEDKELKDYLDVIRKRTFLDEFESEDEHFMPDAHA